MAMKTLSKIISMGLCMGLVALSGCETEEPAKPVDEGLAFHALFSVCCTGSLPNEARIASIPKMHFLQGKGVEIEGALGEFTVRMQLCGDGDEVSHPCCGHYTVAAGKFILGNGDELCFAIPEGQITAVEGDDYYPMCLNDLLVFQGGTGRFAGAVGQATTKARIHAQPGEWQADFEVEGRLNLQASLDPYAPGRENEGREQEVDRFGYRPE